MTSRELRILSKKMRVSTKPWLRDKEPWGTELVKGKTEWVGRFTSKETCYLGSHPMITIICGMYENYVKQAETDLLKGRSDNYYFYFVTDDIFDPVKHIS